jgi:hypothetical protein
MMEKHNLDKLFKSKLAQHQYPYEAGSWSAMESAISSGAGKSGLWWMLGLGGAVALPLVALLNFNMSTTAAVSLENSEQFHHTQVADREVAIPLTDLANAAFVQTETANASIATDYINSSEKIGASPQSTPASAQNSLASPGTPEVAAIQHSSAKSSVATTPGAEAGQTNSDTQPIIKAAAQHHPETGALTSIDRSIVFTPTTNEELNTPTKMGRLSLGGDHIQAGIQVNKQRIIEPLPLFPEANFSRSLSINGGMLLPVRQLSTTDASLNDYVEIRKESELPTMSFATGMGYSQSLGKIEFSTGINYLTIQEKVNYEPITTTTVTINDESYWDADIYTELVIDSTFNPANGAGFWTYDTIEVTVIDSTWIEQYFENEETLTKRFDVNQITKFNYVEIPITFGKTWSVGQPYLGSNQFILGAHAGLGIGLMTSTTGAYINTGLDDLELHAIRQNQLMFNMQASLCLGYRITKGFPMSVQIEPNVRQTLGSIGKVTGVKQSYTLFGVNLTLVKYIGG